VPIVSLDRGLEALGGVQTRAFQKDVFRWRLKLSTEMAQSNIGRQRVVNC